VMSSKITGPMYDGINNAATRNFSTVTEGGEAECRQIYLLWNVERSMSEQWLMK